MKRYFIFAVIAVLALSAILCSCEPKATTDETTAEETTAEVVETVVDTVDDTTAENNITVEPVASDTVAA